MTLAAKHFFCDQLLIKCSYVPLFTCEVMFSRRQFINSCIASGSIATPALSLANSNSNSPLTLEQSLRLHNIHTGEKLDLVLFTGSEMVNENLQQVDHLLRDFRQNESRTMDRKLLLSLCDIQRHFIADSNQHKRIEIISGYRSPKTNAMLIKNGRGVAKKSMHLSGQAIDFRIPGVPIQRIYDYARALKIGGTGRYVNSGFVHIDTGRIRFWG